MLYLNFRPSMQINRNVHELEQTRDQLDSYIDLPDPFTGDLKRHILAESVHYSTKIEGNTLTREQVHSLLSGEKVDAPEDQIQEVQNYREAIDFIQSLVVEEFDYIRNDIIRSIHFMLTKSLPGDYAPGQFRSDQNYVVDRNTNRRIFLPPSHDRVVPLMAELVEWVNQMDELPPVYKAALAHLNLVAIHPFKDGNGRTARVLESLIMYMGGYKSEELVSLESYYGKDTQGYYRALSSALGPEYRPPRDVTPWIDYYVDAHARQAEEALYEIREFHVELEEFHEALAAQDLSFWQVGTLWLTCRRGQLSNRAYRNTTNRSNISAWNDFKVLMGKGWIERIGRGRSVTYIPSAKGWEMFGKVRNKVRETLEPK